MTFKLLVDMNLSPEWIPFLKAAGFEAAHWSSVGAGNATDLEVMNWAGRNGYILLTCDLDFGAILAATRNRNPSVIQIRSENVSSETIGESVVIAIKQTVPELRDGAIVTIDAGRARVRILPLDPQ